LSQIKNFTKKFIKGSIKVFLYTTLCLFLLLAGVLISLQFPYVQTKVVNKATQYLSESLNFPIHIQGVDIDWFDEVVLEGVSVYDSKKGKMIFLGEAIVDFKITSLHEGKFNIDEIILKDGRVNMIIYEPDGENNFIEFLDVMRGLSKPRKKNTKPVPFTVDAISLDNMAFTYFDKRKGMIQDGFDHRHFGFDSIYANVTNLRIVADTFQINVSKLRTFEAKTKLRVHEINTLFTITKADMTFDKLYAHIGESEIKDYLRFNYKDINDLSDFNEKIDVVSYLNESKIDFKNLAEFAPGIKHIKEKATISGFFKGTVTNFKVKELNLAFGKSSRIKGRISFDGLPDFYETFIEFNFKNTHVQAEDLKQYLNESSYSVLKKFGKISGEGDFIGFPQDFVTKGAFSTGLGKLVSDIRLDAKSETKQPEYAGSLKTYAFNLGKLIDAPDKVQFLDMDGKIKGSGFSLEHAEATVNASISRIGINNYNYKNIKTNAKLSERMFNGFISVKDSNLIFTANGKIDLTKNKEIFDIEAHFDRANLKPLNISSVQTLVKTDLVLNFTGTQIDEIVGTASFNNTYLLYQNDKEIAIESLFIESLKNEDSRTVEVKSDLLTLKAAGNFAFTTLYKDVERLYKEYKLNIENETPALASYYSKKNNTKHYDKYSLAFNVDIINLNSLFEIYFPGLYLSQGLTIEGDFTHGHNSVLNLNTHIDTLYYKDNEMFNTNLEISTSKLADSNNVLAMFYINSEKQKLRDLPETKNFFFEGIWDKRIIDFSTNVYQTKSTNSVELQGSLSFLHNIKLLKLYNSNFTLLNKKWSISPDNEIYFNKREITFENFNIYNNTQSLSLNGFISEDQNKRAILKAVNFNLENISSLLTGYRLDGILNGGVVIKDFYKDLNLNSNLSINKFALDGFLIGNLKGFSSWDNNQNRVNIDLAVERDNFVTITVNGFINSQNENNKETVNLNAHLNDAELAILSPILKGVMSDISGKASGDFTIQGSLKDLKIAGKGEVKDGKFTVDYLGTTYYFNDNIYLEENRIAFKKLKLKDEFDNTVIINGGIDHDGFKNFLVNIKGDLNQVNVLNTTEKDNNLFYGSAFVSGDFEIFGPFADLEISANATSKRGTKIYIPLNTSTGIEQQSYITFKSRKDKNKENVETKVDLSGIKLDFNFEITPDAYAEIIFDKRAGDIIRGYGNGNIKMTIDTRGDFNMYGNYRIAKGAYNYTLAGLISREFTIEPNSSISWTGDPYGGILDVRAFFENRIPVTPLISDSLTRKQEIGRTHPVKVILDLDGDLMSPLITMDISITPTTLIARDVATRFESEIKRNEQELNRQVFSLMVLGNFSPENSFSGTSGPASNVSQLLTNQLGNWLSQVDENLIIDIDLNGLDREALNTFNLRLSYTLLDGRLRISRDGSFSNFQNTSQQSVSNIAGEWTVEYLLSQEGKFRLKLYNKNSQNALMNTLNNGVNSSAGFSILHTQTFSTLGDLLGTKKNKNQKSDKNTNGLINLALPPKED
jgi:hypothetical protein